MTVSVRVRLFIHVEEPSMQAALKILLPMLVDDPSVAMKIIDHGSKHALFSQLPQRLRGYARWNDPTIRVLVLVDRDDDDCLVLKQRLEQAADLAGLLTKTSVSASGIFRVVNRIVIEELEAWFLGDVDAVRAAYPGVPDNLANRAGYRDPDRVLGGTWEALHRVLRAAGHYDGLVRLPKIEAARAIAPFMVPARNRSHSFRAFVSGLHALLAC